MADNRPVLLIAFANGISNDKLPYLSEEMEKLNDLLCDYDAIFKIRFIYKATIKKIQKTIDDNKDRLLLFMYSGHSNQFSIETEEHPMSALGLAEKLNTENCPNLSLVFLNGCYSEGHINFLKKVNVPAIIATESLIKDKSASEFSVEFFTRLLKGDTLNEAFKESFKNIKSFFYSVKEDENIKYELKVRFLDFDNIQIEKTNQWVISVNADGKKWKLVEEGLEKTKLILNYSPNKKIHEFLYDWLKTDKEIGRKKDFINADKYILQKFPYFISKFIHDLYALSPPQIPGQTIISPVFTDVNIRRLSRIIEFFSAIQDVLLGIVFSEIREFFINNEPNIEKLTVKAPNLILKNKFSSIDCGILLLKNLNEEQGKKIYVNEVININLDSLESVFDFFVELNQKIIKYKNNPTYSTPLVENWCDEAEEKLVSLLNEIKFIINYKFFTIKNITVYKNRTKKIPEFGIQPAIYEWKLETSHVTEEIETEPFKNAPDTFSVLITKNEGDIGQNLQQGNYLNVSPFLIDKNVIYEKATNIQISFIDEILDDSYSYRSILDSSNQPIKKEPNSFIFRDIDSQVKHYKNIIGQN